MLKYFAPKSDLLSILLLRDVCEAYSISERREEERRRSSGLFLFLFEEKLGFLLGISPHFLAGETFREDQQL